MQRVWWLGCTWEARPGFQLSFFIFRGPTKGSIAPPDELALKLPQYPGFGFQSIGLSPKDLGRWCYAGRKQKVRTHGNGWRAAMISEKCPWSRRFPLHPGDTHTFGLFSSHGPHVPALIQDLSSALPLLGSSGFTCRWRLIVTK